MVRSFVRTVAAVVLLAASLVTTSTHVAAADCLGRSATISGTPGDDRLTGTPGPDVIVGGGGNDTIDGRGADLGEDRLCGGAGNDTIDAGSRTTIDGGGGKDTVSFAAATGSGGVRAHLGIHGGPGETTSGDRFLSVENILGSPGNDIFAGGEGVNVIDGGGGDDRFLWASTDTGDDMWIGGPGDDLADFSAAPGAVRADLALQTATVSGASTGIDRLEGIEDAMGSAFDDELVGSEADNVLFSWIDEAIAGDADLLKGLAGDDDLDASAGGVTFDGDEGNDDMFALGYAPMTIHGGDGNDTFAFGLNNRLDLELGVTNNFHGGPGNDEFIGTGGNDHMFGDGGDDRLFGRGGADVLDGGADSDAASGGPGLDACVNVENPGSDCASDGSQDGVVGDPGPAGPASNIDVQLTRDPQREGRYNLFVENAGPDTAAEVGLRVYTSGAIEEVTADAGWSCFAPSPTDLFRNRMECRFSNLPVGTEVKLNVKVDESRVLNPIFTTVAYNHLFDPTYLFLAPPRDPDWENNAATEGGSTLLLTGLEVTQGIQNLQNDVTLVAGRRTIVRAHVESTGPRAEMVLGTLRGEIVGGADLGEVISRSSVDVVADPPLNLVSRSFIFELPAAWVTGHGESSMLELTFEGRGRSFLCEDIDQDCSALVNLVEVPSPRFTFVGLDYKEDDGTARPATLATAATARKQLLQILPVSDVVYNFHPGFLQLSDPQDSQGERTYLLIAMQTFRQLVGCRGPTAPTCIHAGLLEDSKSTGGGGMGALGALVAHVEGEPHWTLPHEAIHALGRFHTDCPGMGLASLVTENYPYPDGILSQPTEGPSAFWGMDVYSGIAYPPLKDPAKTHDVMSYCSPTWMSDYTWAAVMNSVERDFASSSDPVFQQRVADALLIGGRVATDGSGGGFDTSMRADADLSEPGAGPFSIRFVGAGGATLQTDPIDTMMTPDDPSRSFFSVALEVPASTAEVQLLHDTTVLDTIAVTTNAPTVEITSVSGTGDTLGVEWQASDADGDALSYSIDYSTDGGTTWTPVLFETELQSVQLDTSGLPASAQAFVRVRVDDGFLTSSDSFGPFTVAEHAPEVILLDELDFRPFVAGQEIVVEAMAFDPEDGPLTGSALQWSSNLDGALGTGETLVLDAADLSPGTHRISVEAADSSGRASNVSATVHVFADPTQVPTCFGRSATLLGTGASDIIVGSTEIDVIAGVLGNDEIKGGNAADILCGGGGKDSLVGGKGRDSFNGGPGRDTCSVARKERTKSCERPR